MATRRRKTVKKVTKLGSKRFRLTAGQSRAVPVQMSRRGRRKVKRARKVKMDVTVSTTSSLGTTSTTRSVTVLFRRQPKPSKRTGRKK